MKLKRIGQLLLCVCLLNLFAPTVYGTALYSDHATALNKIGVFAGDEHGNYMLESESTRIQGLIMLLRLTGKEAEAKKSTAATPFKDVPQWCQAYVSYAYANSITMGMSKTEFGADVKMDYKMYLTFLLRSLGYTDANQTDFTFDTALSKAVSIGLVKEQEQASLLEKPFLRDYMAYYSFCTLFSPMKGQPTSALIERLVDQNGMDISNALSNDLFASYYNNVLND